MMRRKPRWVMLIVFGALLAPAAGCATRDQPPPPPFSGQSGLTDEERRYLQFRAGHAEASLESLQRNQ